MREERRMKVYEEWIPFWFHQSVGALAQLIGRPLEWHAEAARRLSMPTVPSDAGDQVLVYVRARDPWCRLWVVGWPGSEVRQVLRWLLPTRFSLPEPLWLADGPSSESSVYGSALLETGNVMSGVFFTAIAGYTRRALVPEPPGLIVGDAATCRARLQHLTAAETGTWVLVEGRLTSGDQTCFQWMGVFLREDSRG
jgi:chemotaxis protein CheY-P-specific phosphatase CheC